MHSAPCVDHRVLRHNIVVGEDRHIGADPRLQRVDHRSKRVQPGDSAAILSAEAQIMARGLNSGKMHYRSCNGMPARVQLAQARYPAAQDRLVIDIRGYQRSPVNEVGDDQTGFSMHQSRGDADVAGRTHRILDRGLDDPVHPNVTANSHDVFASVVTDHEVSVAQPTNQGTRPHPSSKAGQPGDAGKSCGIS